MVWFNSCCENSGLLVYDCGTKLACCSSVFVSASGFQVPLPLQKSKIKILAVYRDGSVRSSGRVIESVKRGVPSSSQGTYCMQTVPTYVARVLFTFSLSLQLTVGQQVIRFFFFLAGVAFHFQR